MTNELRDDPLVPQAEPGGCCSIHPPGERPKRKPIPLKARLEACLLLLKIDPKDVQWDHDPPLGLRGINGTDYDPPQHDPRYIQPLSKAVHALKTDGDHVPLSSDKSRIAKAKRLERGPSCREALAAGKAAREADLSLSTNPHAQGTPERSKWSLGWFNAAPRPALTVYPRPKRKIPSRPFPERWKPTGETK